MRIIITTIIKNIIFVRIASDKKNQNYYLKYYSKYYWIYYCGYYQNYYHYIKLSIDVKGQNPLEKELTLAMVNERLYLPS